jgi:hypothetical protein
MNAAEMEWLSQFISETEHGNLNKTKQIRTEVSELRGLRSNLRAAKKDESIDEMVILENSVKEKLDKIEKLREDSNNFYTSEDDVKDIYTRDNERRRDVYNNAKISNRLVMYDITEYDKFSTEAYKSIDPENLVLEHLHFVPQKRNKKK